MVDKPGSFPMAIAFGFFYMLSAVALGDTPVPGVAQRAFTVDDLFQLESLGRYYGGPFAFSTDGKMLAYTRIRGKKTLTNYKWEYLWDNAGGDVWVSQQSGDAPINITNGAIDGSGWWAPQWSPDGENLALLSTRGGNVRVWIWNLKSRSLHLLNERGVAIADVQQRPLEWIDNDHLLYPALPIGEQPLSMTIELQTPIIATSEWAKTPKGIESTANLLDSGVPVDLARRPLGDLLLVDVVSGRERIVVHGNTQTWVLSPDRRGLALTRQVSTYLPSPAVKVPLDFSGVSTLEVSRVDGKPMPLNAVMSRDVLTDSVRWSPNGREIAFLGYATGRAQPPRLYRLNVAARTLDVRSLGSLDAAPNAFEPTGIEWTRQGEILLHAAMRIDDKRADSTIRRDWWLIERNGTATPVTSKLTSAPDQLWAKNGRQAFIGLSSGKIWMIEAARRKLIDLTARFDGKVNAIVWPSMANSGEHQYAHSGNTYQDIIFSVGDGRTDSFYLLNLASGTISPILNPHPGANFVDYEPRTRTGVFFSADRTGLGLWRSSVPIGVARTLASANGFLRDIAESEFKPIEYTSLGGEKLKGWLMLPIGYDATKRYRMITWVYPGTIYSDRPPAYDGIDSNSSLNLQLATAKGYVVLLPSMPLPAEAGIPGDPMLRLQEGVLPAIDKSIELGIADPAQIFLMGQSFGGFATYGLITQTQRFRAAVALAGPADLISLYGQFDARVRYTLYPHENIFGAALMESGQFGLGNPPWKDFGRYIRNSPIFFVDRVQTPLLIIQGDVDYVALQQGEEFFTSLYRQGKRAEFVRYWGEGHVLQSPANIRDMWKKIFDWLDEFSAGGGQ